MADIDKIKVASTTYNIRDDRISKLKFSNKVYTLTNAAASGNIAAGATWTGTLTLDNITKDKDNKTDRTKFHADVTNGYAYVGLAGYSVAGSSGFAFDQISSLKGNQTDSYHITVQCYNTTNKSLAIPKKGCDVSVILAKPVVG